MWRPTPDDEARARRVLTAARLLRSQLKDEAKRLLRIESGQTNDPAGEHDLTEEVDMARGHDMTRRYLLRHQLRDECPRVSVQTVNDIATVKLEALGCYLYALEVRGRLQDDQGNQNFSVPTEAERERAHREVARLFGSFTPAPRQGVALTLLQRAQRRLEMLYSWENQSPPVKG